MSLMKNKNKTCLKSTKIASPCHPEALVAEGSLCKNRDPSLTLRMTHLFRQNPIRACLESIYLTTYRHPEALVAEGSLCKNRDPSLTLRMTQNQHEIANPRHALVSILVGCSIFLSCRTMSLKEDGMVQIDKTKTRAEVIVSGNEHSLAAAPAETKEVKKMSSSLASTTTMADKTNLAQLYVLQGKFIEAETLCQGVLKEDANNKEALKTLVAVYMGQKNLPAVKYVLGFFDEESALKDSDVQNMYGLISLAEGEYFEAISRFEKGLAANPDNAAIRLNLGVLYLKGRFLEEAEEQFKQVLQNIPTQKDARLHLAIIYAVKEKNEFAKDLYKSLLADYGENPILLYNVAVLQKNTKAYEDALDTIESYFDSKIGKDRPSVEKFARLFDELEKIQTAANKKVDDDLKLMVTATLREAGQKDESIAETSKADDAASNVAMEGEPKKTEDKKSSEPLPEKSTKKAKETFNDEEIDTLKNELDAH